ncbi:GAF domain-containing protein [Steroidobacter sp.]|uniref:GAF domain-containing protein n=1 Tax=Steroidobacter sp. TaxID=1978227 RepID=UPI001A463472|nr:GAF domain-containing protein [Steroidobacter sp.]MBL8269064.1 GAF domain-containing protein [Steroidobacter sp.]
MLKKAELTAAEIDQFVEIAGNSLVATLKAGRKKHEFFLSIMKQRPGAQRLFTTHVYPKGTVKIDLSQELPLEISEDGLPNSAAGACFLRNSVIYVPSTRHLSGIEITGVEKKDLRPIGLVYKPIKIEPGPSLLCVPVIKSGVVAAVLNISSSKRDAFMVEDVDIGRLVAALLHDCV